MKITYRGRVNSLHPQCACLFCESNLSRGIEAFPWRKPRRSSWKWTKSPLTLSKIIQDIDLDMNSMAWNPFDHEKTHDIGNILCVWARVQQPGGRGNAVHIGYCTVKHKFPSTEIISPIQSIAKDGQNGGIRCLQSCTAIGITYGNDKS